MPPLQYWLVKPPSSDVYTVDDQRLVGRPDTPPVAQVRLRLSLDGMPFALVRPVHYRYAGRAEGERERALVVVPPVAVNLPEAVAIFPSAAARKVARSRDYDLTVHLMIAKVRVLLQR